ncbi:MAG TPA: AmmeMemoRadiSam system protein B [Candidatus Woesearchaeota archaeon]|nr:AmmeMemoRadiSam system protein B [Candidatus Woesearchaeota archaeon]
MKAREPAVAGMFYPAEESELRTEIKQFLGNAEIKLTQ